MIISDIDECSEGSNTCDQSANCTNTNGSFKCECKIGYLGDGHTCTGIYTTFQITKLIFTIHHLYIIYIYIYIYIIQKLKPGRLQYWYEEIERSIPLNTITGRAIE